jgi:hypothetical protein
MKTIPTIILASSTFILISCGNKENGNTENPTIKKIESVIITNNNADTPMINNPNSVEAYHDTNVKMDDVHGLKK